LEAAPRRAAGPPSFLQEPQTMHATSRILIAFTTFVMIVGTAAAAEPAEPVVAPADNLVAQGIPPIPASLAEQVGRYADFRAAVFVDWHPTRREMLINTRFADTAQVHYVKMPGGARTQLTFYKEPARGGLVRPKRGDSFVFLKDVGGNEFFQLFRYDLASGGVAMLTDGKSRNTGPEWSDDGSLLAYTSTRRNGKDNDVYAIDPADPKTERRVVEVEGGGWGVHDWSPDGKSLLLGEYVSANESYLWLADAATGQKKLITPKGGPEKVAYDNARFAKDGRAVYATTDKGGEFLRLARVALDTGEHTFLTADINWDVEEFVLSHDGRTIAFVTNEEGVSRLYLMDTQSKQRKAVESVPAGVIQGLRWHENDRDLGFTLVSARSTADAYSVDVATGRLDRWTFSETGGLNPETFAEPKLVRWTTFDNRQLSGFLYAPDPKKFPGKRPVVVDVHGGPESQFRPVFIGRDNYLINELGVAVLFPNVRGSSGYGKTFLTLDNGTKREDSYKDLGTLLDWVKTQADLDASRVMVTGGSYGGHMTFVAAVRYSDRLRCAMPEVGMSNLVSFLERTEAYRRDLRRAEYGDERDPMVREFLLRIAPLNNAAQIHIPLFVVQGANDPRVPATEAEQMVSTVRGNGQDVWYLLAKDEGHGFAKKKNRDFLLYAQVMFVKQHLLGDGKQAGGETK
jgi:dipeptidyl aminopeptidase/acylaminoacyl peptidase